jgi:hypothetical protein
MCMGRGLCARNACLAWLSKAAVMLTLVLHEATTEEGC